MLQQLKNWNQSTLILFNMEPLIIAQNITSSENSLSFRVNLGNLSPQNEKLYLGIYGTITGSIINLRYKAPDGSFYNTGDTFNSTGLYVLPFSNQLVLDVNIVIANSDSVSVVVYNGIQENGGAV